MEALAAVGLVSAICQLLDFSSKLVTGTLQNYHTGNIRSDDVLRAALDLEGLKKQLLSQDSTPDQGLIDVSEACAGAADRLIKALQELRVHTSGNGWSSFKKALKSIWKKDEILQMQNDLVVLRTQLSLRIGAAIRRDLSGLKRTQDAGFLSLDEKSKAIVEAIADHKDILDCFQQTQQDLLHQSSTLHHATTLTIRTENEKTRDLVLDIETARQQSALREKISEWLSSPSPFPNYERALKQRQPGTGRWYIDSENYLRWEKGSACMTWLHGIPGSGKSILSSTVIENLRPTMVEARSAVVFFFFDFTDTQKIRSELMLYSLLQQLVSQCSSVPHAVKALRESCSSGKTKPSLDATMKVFHEILLGFSSCHVIIDALDECDDRGQLLNILEQWHDWKVPGLKVFAASRAEAEILATMQHLVAPKDIIILKSTLVKDDIRTYICRRIYNGPDFSRWTRNQDIQQQIESALIDGAHGMFRWAACQLDTLSKCVTPKMVHAALQSLPPDLESTYERILCSIHDAYSEIVLRLLLWVAFADRPLELDEVAEALAIDSQRNPPFDAEDKFPEPLELLGICPGLVTLVTDDRETENVCLTHLSVKEYLTSDRIRQGPAARYWMHSSVAHTEMARDCLAYFQQFHGGPWDCSWEPLSRYSARHWMAHFEKAQQDERLIQQVDRLLSSHNPAYHHWISASIYDKTAANYQHYWAPLQAAVFHGSSKLVDLLVQRGDDVNVGSSTQRKSPLNLAVNDGKDKIATTLLTAGADIEGRSGEGMMSAIEIAIDRDRPGSARCLIEAGASLPSESTFCRCFFEYLGWDGSIRKKSLPRRLTILNDQQAPKDRLLHTLAYLGKDSWIRLSWHHFWNEKLLSGVLIDSQGISPLHFAALAGHTSTIELLTKLGLDIDARDRRNMSVMSYAALSGSMDTVLAVWTKQPVTDEDTTTWGSLHWAAAMSGYPEVYAFLLKQGYRDYKVRTLEPEREWGARELAVYYSNTTLTTFLDDTGHRSPTSSADQQTEKGKLNDCEIGREWANVVCDGCEQVSRRHYPELPQD